MPTVANYNPLKYIHLTMAPFPHRINELYSDEALLAVSKPAGVPVTPDRYRDDLETASQILEPRWGKLWIVHRIDRETSGVLLYSRTAHSHKLIVSQFASRDVHKVYHLLVLGIPKWKNTQVDVRLLPDGDRKHRTIVEEARGKPSLTRFRVLNQYRHCALLEAIPETGRTHQIRIHATLLGHPLVADRLYGNGNPLFLSSFKRSYRKSADEERPLIGRVALHALSVRLIHPITGNELCVTAPYCRDFRASVNQLRKHALRF